MKKLETYIEDKNIIFYLCRIRAKIARERNQKHLIHLISHDSKKNYHVLIDNKPSDETTICSLFPSRRKWRKLGENNRCRNGKNLNSLEKNIKSLQLTIKWYRINEPNAEFLKRLNTFILAIQNSIANKNYSISEPLTYPKLKDKLKKEPTECRPISIFKLQDRIIICLINKYYTDLFDDFFHDSSMAFRAVKKVNGKIHNITHHDAIKQIVDYKQKNKGKKLWVSECDMKKFYDTVNHTVIKKHFKSLILKIKRKRPELYSINAEHIFYSYLECYSFNKSVYPHNRNQNYFSNFSITNGIFNWVEGDLLAKHYKKLNNAKIGIPQGGALSGLIANIVLHYSDTLIAKSNHKNLLYLRYCDDMIIMHPNKRVCKSATITYQKSLLKLKLVPHIFKDVKKYDRDFWKNKSKNPYKWGEFNKQEIPWIGFVGYELNFNGDIRIRKNSLKKEMSKQIEVMNTALNAIKGKNKRASNKYIENSVIQRLIGMSVGRVTMWNYENGINDLCWINGFSQLSNNPTVAIQLKRLDKNRNKYFNQFRQRVRKIETQKKVSTKVKPARQMIYFGKPFSYYYHAYEKTKSTKC